jgi:hypothetical protein
MQLWTADKECYENYADAHKGTKKKEIVGWFLGEIDIHRASLDKPKFINRLGSKRISRLTLCALREPLSNRTFVEMRADSKMIPHQAS